MLESRLHSALDAARSLISDGHFAQARVALLDLTREFPNFAQAWKSLGVAEHKLGNLQDAVQHLRRSLAIDDGDTDTWSSLGGVHTSMKEYEEAKRCYERAVLADPESTYALLNLLVLQSRSGPVEDMLVRFRGALEAGKRHCREQVERNTNLPWCAYDLAQIAFFERDWGSFDANISTAIQHSAEWQIDSAAKAYETLVESETFRADALRARDQIRRIRH